MTGPRQEACRHTFFRIRAERLLIVVLWTIAFRCRVLPAPLGPVEGFPHVSRSEVQSSGGPARPLQGALDEALAKGQIEKARAIVRNLLQNPHLESETLLRAGIKLAERELYVEASETFARCVRDFPQLFVCRYDLALADVALGRNTEALTAVEGLSRASAEEQVALVYLRGKIEAAMGKDREAERDLSEAFSRAPDQANYALDFGLHLIRTRNYQKSMEVFERGARLHQESPYLGLGLALAEYLGGRYAESEDTCRTLLRRQPDLSPARVLLAFMLYTKGQFREAEQTAAAALDSHDPFPYLHYLHAVALLKLDSKQYDQMQHDLRLALRAFPTCTICYLALGKVHERSGDVDTATSDLEKSVTLDPSFAEAWYHLAALYERAGRHSKALKARRRFNALKRDKTDRESEMMQQEIFRTLGGTSPSRDSR